MASEQTFSTGDLRSGARDFARDKNHRVKWAHGQSFGPGRRADDARPRPARVIPTPKSHTPFANKAQKALKRDIALTSDESSSSADEDVEEPSAAPDADITYSYDAERGPSHGSQVLGQALTQAIGRFESRETDKLIKAEYDVLDRSEEPLSPAPKARKNVAPEDEDYEFIEA